jgi:hypothetical protein
MKTLYLISLLMMTSCSTLPELYRDVENIATNNAVDISLSKEVIESGKNLTISIELKGKNDAIEKR